MKYVAKHGMSDLDRVKTVIDKAYEAYQEKLASYEPNLTWRTDREATVDFTVMKKKIDANFTITEEEIRVDGNIPFIFRPFQGKIEAVVGAEIEKWIAKAKAGEI